MLQFDMNEDTSSQENRILEDSATLNPTPNNNGEKNCVSQCKQLDTNAGLRTNLRLFSSTSENENLNSSLTQSLNDNSKNAAEPLRFSLSLETEDCLPSVDSISPQNCLSTNVSNENTPKEDEKISDFSLSEAFSNMALSTPVRAPNVRSLSSLEALNKQDDSLSQAFESSSKDGSIPQIDLSAEKLPGDNLSKTEVNSQNIAGQGFIAESISTREATRLPTSPFHKLIGQSLSIIGAVASSLSKSPVKTPSKIKPEIEEYSLSQETVNNENTVLSSKNLSPVVSTTGVFVSTSPVSTNTLSACCEDSSMSNKNSESLETKLVNENLSIESQKGMIQGNMNEAHSSQIKTVSKSESNVGNIVSSLVKSGEPIVLKAEDNSNDHFTAGDDNLTSNKILVKENSMLMEFSVLDENQNTHPEVSQVAALSSVSPVASNKVVSPLSLNVAEMPVIDIAKPSECSISESVNKNVTVLEENFEVVDINSDTQVICQSVMPAIDKEMAEISNANVSDIDTGLTLKFSQPTEIVKELDFSVPSEDFAFKMPGSVSTKEEEKRFTGCTVQLPRQIEGIEKLDFEMPSVDCAFKLSETAVMEEQFAGSTVQLPQQIESRKELAFDVPSVNCAFKLSETAVIGEEQLTGATVQLPQQVGSVKELDFEVPSAGFAFKLPEAPDIEKEQKEFGYDVPSDDFAFKVPEAVPTGDEEEQFTDAVQFFKDPNSFQYLENRGVSSMNLETNILRSSLFVNFDPLHSKVSSHPRPDNCALVTQALKESQQSIDKNLEGCTKDVRESMGNILISFDSPMHQGGERRINPPTPKKLYSEEELQQTLKTRELLIEEVYLTKQREMEEESIKKLQEAVNIQHEKAAMVVQLTQLVKRQRIIIEELKSIALTGKDKIDALESENSKLKNEVNVITEDFQSVEHTFADFHKRYEQSKAMLRTYKENEEHMKQNVVDWQNKLKEQEQMYLMLQERTNETLEKANAEVNSVKKSSDAQITVLKAQLKKAEMKISGLESDIKQITSENKQLGGICDDLMAKVGES